MVQSLDMVHIGHIIRQTANATQIPFDGRWYVHSQYAAAIILNLNGFENFENQKIFSISQYSENRLIGKRG